MLCASPHPVPCCLPVAVVISKPRDCQGSGREAAPSPADFTRAEIGSHRSTSAATEATRLGQPRMCDQLRGVVKSAHTETAEPLQQTGQPEMDGQARQRSKGSSCVAIGSHTNCRGPLTEVLGIAGYPRTPPSFFLPLCFASFKV